MSQHSTLRQHNTMRQSSTVNQSNTFRQFVKGALVALMPRSMFMVAGDPASRSVFLTFDDGPHATYTPAVLDALAEANIKATFFLVGERVAMHPMLTRRIAAEGHTVGHHSYTHSPPETTSSARLFMEAKKTSALIQKVTGRAPVLFRPPHGKLTAKKLLRLWTARQTVVLWNVDPKDFACSNVEEVAAFFRSRPLESGDIILLHDNHPHAATILPELVAATHKAGLHCRAINRRAD